MTDNSRVNVWSLAALGVAAGLPFAAACGANSNQPATTAGAGTAAMTAQPMSPYATVAQPQQAPPGYPGAAAPPGYPTQQTGYPAQQPAYAPTAAPTYAPQPTYPPAQAYPTAAAPAPTAPAATPAPAGTLAPTDPNSLQGILQGIQTAIQGTVVPGGAVPTDITEAGLKAYALKAAQGMQPEGDELKQTMTEGQHAVMMVTLQAGKCYSIVGFSAPGAVKDLDLNLLAPPLYVTLAGQDLTHNNTPSIGGTPNPMCPVLAFPLQYKLDVFAKSGSGQVAVQLFSKTKS
jgi:hypothetical protein